MRILICQHRQMTYQGWMEVLGSVPLSDCDMLVLPENCLVLPQAMEKGMSPISIDNPPIRMMARFAQQKAIYMVLGSVPESIEDEDGGMALYSTCVVIGRQGQILHSYRRRGHRHLKSEKAGSELGLFRTEFGLIGILLSQEVEDMKLVRALPPCRLVINPTLQSPPIDTTVFRKIHSIQRRSWQTHSLKTARHLLSLVLPPSLGGRHGSSLGSYLRVDQPIPFGYGSSMLVEPHRTVMAPTPGALAFRVTVTSPQELRGLLISIAFPITVDRIPRLAKKRESLERKRHSVDKRRDQVSSGRRSSSSTPASGVQESQSAPALPRTEVVMKTTICRYTLWTVDRYWERGEVIPKDTLLDPGSGGLSPARGSMSSRSHSAQDMGAATPRTPTPRKSLIGASPRTRALLSGRGFIAVIYGDFGKETPSDSLAITRAFAVPSLPPAHPRTSTIRPASASNTAPRRMQSLTALPAIRGKKSPPPSSIDVRPQSSLQGVGKYVVNFAMGEMAVIDPVAKTVVFSQPLPVGQKLTALASLPSMSSLSVRQPPIVADHATSDGFLVASTSTISRVESPVGGGTKRIHLTAWKAGQPVQSIVLTRQVVREAIVTRRAQYLETDGDEQHEESPMVQAATKLRFHTEATQGPAVDRFGTDVSSILFELSDNSPSAFEASHVHWLSPTCLMGLIGPPTTSQGAFTMVFRLQWSIERRDVPRFMAVPCGVTPGSVCASHAVRQGVFDVAGLRGEGRMGGVGRTGPLYVVICREGTVLIYFSDEDQLESICVTLFDEMQLSPASRHKRSTSRKSKADGPIARIVEGPHTDDSDIVDPIVTAAVVSAPSFLWVFCAYKRGDVKLFQLNLAEHVTAKVIASTHFKHSFVRLMVIPQGLAHTQPQPKPQPAHAPAKHPHHPQQQQQPQPQSDSSSDSDTSSGDTDIIPTFTLQRPRPKVMMRHKRERRHLPSYGPRRDTRASVTEDGIRRRQQMARVAAHRQHRQLHSSHKVYRDCYPVPFEKRGYRGIRLPEPENDDDTTASRQPPAPQRSLGSASGSSSRQGRGKDDESAFQMDFRFTREGIRLRVQGILTGGDPTLFTTASGLRFRWGDSERLRASRTSTGLEQIVQRAMDEQKQKDTLEELEGRGMAHGLAINDWTKRQGWLGVGVNNTGALVMFLYQEYKFRNLFNCCEQLDRGKLMWDIVSDGDILAAILDDGRVRLFEFEDPSAAFLPFNSFYIAEGPHLVPPAPFPNPESCSPHPAAKDNRPSLAEILTMPASKRESVA
ncbi:unnamed protein product [Vitrella brassicaformis CCMP3155]|uniref:CN hydrolase domain-containing protein n=1 Tax=Vitrella brassicaformis (strain CCMP3155) TaxID=1169540 RepID=A0A0G4GF55_VITBC|nr:unnamed protein product [Vitrella brassicaformis CCMP3155]|eukprot:CEM28144.1 unnamed protein product [Vitrella brassicaformis CCMP3155]